MKEWFRALLKRDRRDDGERRLAPYLDDEDVCVVLRLIFENPGITAETIAGRARLREGVAEAYLKKLKADGLVILEPGSVPAGYHIDGAAKAAVAERLPLNYQCPGLKRE